jgi:hypothetical protein
VPERQRWEYSIRELPISSGAFRDSRAYLDACEQQMNAAGLHGWELVGLHPYKGELCLFYRRPLEVPRA